MDLTNEQWKILEPLLPKARMRKDGRGRPGREPRAVLNGILWILRTGAPCKDLPVRYPSYQTCHRRFQKWNKDGTLKKILRALYQHLRGTGVEDMEGFIDGSYVKAKNGVPKSENVVPERQQRLWQLQTEMVFLSPLASQTVRVMTSR